MGSGNLGLVWFTGNDHRLTAEELEDLHPKLVSSLAAHPGVAMLMVKSEEFGAVVLGPRLGRVFARDGGGPMLPHNILLGAVGGLILWFGWYGFNPGSTLSAMDFIGDTADCLPGAGSDAGSEGVVGNAGSGGDA